MAVSIDWGSILWIRALRLRVYDKGFYELGVHFVDKSPTT